MPYAVVIVPVAPLRMESAHRSEMISQLLWGECVEIIATAPGSWVQVKNQYDGYVGWVAENQLEEVGEDVYNAPVLAYLPEYVNEVNFQGTAMQVPFGCLVKGDRLMSKWGRYNVFYPRELGSLRIPEADRERMVIATAYKYLGTGYLWGGRSVFGIDCSGFTQNVYKMVGIPLLRDAYQQATQGAAVDFLQEARPGDLAFFDNEEGRITHVGILLSEERIIHASGRVRVDPIDNQGITNIDTGERTHKLRIIKRFL